MDIIVQRRANEHWMSETTTSAADDIMTDIQLILSYKKLQLRAEWWILAVSSHLHQISLKAALINRLVRHLLDAQAIRSSYTVSTQAASTEEQLAAAISSPCKFPPLSTPAPPSETQNHVISADFRRHEDQLRKHTFQLEQLDDCQRCNLIVYGLLEKARRYKDGGTSEMIEHLWEAVLEMQMEVPDHKSKVGQL